MNGFNGVSPNGNWTLTIRDDQSGGGNEMFFISYTLNITTAIATNYRLVSETPIKAGHDVIVNTTYSANCSDNEGAITAITRTTSTPAAMRRCLTKMFIFLFFMVRKALSLQRAKVTFFCVLWLY